MLSGERWVLLQLDALATRMRPAGERGPEHLRTGVRGELEAFFYLRRHGYIIVARRWTSPKMRGDVDLIAWRGDRLCFIEVKTRTARDMAPAQSAVDEIKRRTLRGLAHAYLKRFSDQDRRRFTVRFDVAAVYLIGDAVEIEILPGAFTLAR